MIEVSVIVSAYNDGVRLGECLSKLYRLPFNYEFLVATKKGKGKAIVESAKKAKGEIIVTVDSDFKDVSLIPFFVSKLQMEKADILVFERTYKNHRPLKRRIASNLFRGYVQTLFGELPDTQHGFKVFRKSALLDSYRINGFAWDVEFITEAKKQGLKIIEVPMLTGHSESNFRVLSSGAKMASDLFGYWLENNWSKLYLSLSLFYLFALITASTVMKIPVGTDVHFHLDVAAIWASGQNGMFSEQVMALNQFPYPPLFHWLLVPSVWLHIEFLWAKALQIMLPFGIYLTTTLFMMRHTNPKATVVTAMILMSTVGFTDGTIQCRPQGLAMLLLPLTLHYLLTRQNRGFLAVNTCVAYIHGIAGLANTWMLLLRNYFNRKMFKTFLTATFLLLPLIATTAIYFSGALTKWGGHMDTYQEYLVFTQPQNMIPYYAGTSLIGWIFVAYTLTKWDRSTELEKVLALSVLGLTVMIPFWADRFLQYAIIGLSCLAGLGITRNRRLFYILVPLIAVMLVAVQVNIFWVTFTDNWWLYPP